MLRFQHIEYLWFLLDIPLMIVIYIVWLKQRQAKLLKIGDLQLVNELLPNYSQRRNTIKFTLLVLALFFGVISLANLQSGARSEKVSRKGIDVMIALDVSKSMLAKDVSPNRLEKSKQFILRLLEKLSNNRIGLIIFAGKAYTSVPLTVDISALKMNLSTANPDMVPTQGTVLGDAISMASESFNSKETKYKSIVLISDGEDHDETAIDQVKKAVDEALDPTNILLWVRPKGLLFGMLKQGKIKKMKKGMKFSQNSTKMNCKQSHKTDKEFINNSIIRKAPWLLS